MRREALLSKIAKVSRLADGTTGAESASIRAKLDEMLRRYEDEFGDAVISSDETLYLPAVEAHAPRTRLGVRIYHSPMATLQVIPDASVRSGKAVEYLLNAVHSMREGLMERYWTEGTTLWLKAVDYVSWRIVYELDSIRFYCTCPQEVVDSIKHSLEVVWPKAAILDSDPLVLEADKCACGHLELREHFFRATKVARDENAPMSALLSNIRHLQRGDRAVVDIALIALGDTWRHKARKARQQHSRGSVIKRPPNKWHEVALIATDWLTDRIEGGMALLDETLSAKPEKGDKRELPRDLTSATQQKYDHHGFETYIRLAAQSNDSKRANRTLHSLANAFSEVGGDNEWVLHDDSRKSAHRLIHGHLGIYPRGNILSIPEASQLLQLPTQPLQEEWAQVQRIQLQETEIPSVLTKGGIYLGTAGYKTGRVDVYQPVKNHDEAVAVRIIIAPTGQGKTTFSANLAVEYWRNGYGFLIVDPGKGQAGDMIERCIGKQNVIRYRFGREAYNLDWVEAKHAGVSRKWLSDAAVSFFGAEEDMGGQTARFLSAGIMAMKSGRLMELQEIFQEEDTLKEAIAGLPDGMHKTTLQEFAHYKFDMRSKILSPIYNRLNAIFGDPYLVECMESDNTIDMLALITQPKVVVIDLPDEVDRAAKNLIVHLLILKLDLAMRLRQKVYGDESLIPFVVSLDEAHQYLRVAKLCEMLVVESRKFRVGYAFEFHLWSQIPEALQKVLKNNNANYHLFAGAEEGLHSLASRIKPFTVDEGMQLPNFHAINLLRAHGQPIKPFIAHMAQPRRVKT